jgi:ketosteroid isomerase-like protein
MKERNDTERLVREIYARRRSGNIDEIMSAFAPNAQFRLAGGAALLPATALVETHAGLRSTMAQFVADWDWSDYAIEAVIVDGNRAAVYSRGPMRYGAGRQEIETETVDLLTLEGGKIVSFVQFCDTHMLSRVTGLGA